MDKVLVINFILFGVLFYYIYTRQEYLETFETTPINQGVLDSFKEAVIDRQKKVEMAKKIQEKNMEISKNIVKLMRNSPKINHSEFMKYLEYQKYDTNIKLWDKEFFRNLKKDPIPNLVFERLD
jgi:hypothetical protein